jgi:hypothetical protein
MTLLASWQNFYMIVGSAAGALVGLQFVAMSLVADRPLPGMAEAVAAFGTPTIVHLASVLLVAVVGSVPWPGRAALGIAWTAIGFGGLGYTALIGRRLVRVRNVYHAVLEDWLTHVLLPATSYLLLALAQALFLSHESLGLFGAGGATVLLLFTSIHNAWDSVTYHIFTIRQKQRS